MEALRSTCIAAAVIEIDGEVMLVRQQGPDDPAPSWSLPGGRVEAGESLVEALGRELMEETGLTLDDASPALLYVCEVIDPGEGVQTVVYVFRVRVLSESAPFNDPDNFIQEARFMPLADAIEYLLQHPYLPMCEAPSACLRGDGASFWSYRVSPLGVVERILPT